jgi:hypothetical protein
VGETTNMWIIEIVGGAVADQVMIRLDLLDFVLVGKRVLDFVMSLRRSHHGWRLPECRVFRDMLPLGLPQAVKDLQRAVSSNSVFT